MGVKQLNLSNTAACVKILSKFNLQSVVCKACPHRSFYFAFSMSALHLTNKFWQTAWLAFGPHCKDIFSTNTVPFLTSLTRPSSLHEEITIWASTWVFIQCCLVIFLLPGCTISTTLSGRYFMAFCDEGTYSRRWKDTGLRREVFTCQL